MTVATLDDVQGSLMRYLEDDEKTWVQALLDRAEALILSRMPDAVNRCRVDYSFYHHADGGGRVGLPCP